MAQFESDLERSFKRQREAARQQLGKSGTTTNPVPANTGVSNPNVTSFSRGYTSASPQEPTDIVNPRTGVSNAPETFTNANELRFVDRTSPQLGGPASTIEGQSGQRAAGGAGGAGAALGDASGVGVTKYQEPDDFTSFGELTIDRPDSPGQQGSRLGANFQGNSSPSKGTFNVIGKQEYDPNHVVAQRLQYELDYLRNKNNSSPGGSSGTTEDSSPQFQTVDRDEQLLASRKNLDSQIRNIREMYARGKINGRTALDAEQAARERHQELLLGGETVDTNREKTRIGFVSDERGRGIEKEKLGYNREKDRASNLLDLYKSQQDIAENERKFGLDLAKYNLDVNKFSNLAQDRAAADELERQKLGISAGQLGVSGQNAATNVQSELRNMWKGVQEGVITPEAARDRKSVV